MNFYFGLLGEKLSHSLSPQIHSYIFRQLGIDAGYQLFPIKPDELFAALTGLKILGADGVNITIPYKVAIMSMLDEISQEAKDIGAVNTIVFNNRRAKGYNTDYQGFGQILTRHSIDIKGKTAVVLGTGGAAKTVACYLRDHKISDVHMVTRNLTDYRLEFPLWSYAELASSTGADIMINCTPVGMFPNIRESPVDRQIFKKCCLAIDLIYNPAETLFLREARECGLRTCNGLTMLIGQAVYAQELWQNRKIDMAAVDPLYSLLLEHLHN
jgi:shikimate dehydrogenase